MVTNDLRARLVVLSGDVDFASSEKLAHLHASFAACDVVVLDLTQVRFADTTLLRFLLQLRKQARDDVENPVRLLGPAPAVRRLLEVTGLVRRFGLYGTLAQATRDVVAVELLPSLLAS